MEAAGAQEIWKRSVATRKLRYDEVIADEDGKVIADEDGKTIAKLNEAKVYGEVVIEKHECVGHIQKQVGNRGNTAKRDRAIFACS